MNPTAVFSKSGKGVQEASGKTSHLSRADRAVLAAFDGKITVADVAEKVDQRRQRRVEQGHHRQQDEGGDEPAPLPPVAGRPLLPVDWRSDHRCWTLLPVDRLH